MKSIKVIEQFGEDDFSIWGVEISDEDYQKIIDKYGNDGCSVRGSQEDIIEALKNKEV